MANEDKKWERLSSEVGPDLKLFRVRWDDMRNPRNQQSHRMIILQSRDAVNVVAITPQKTMVFVRQYRFGIEDFTLELPGGLVNHDEDMEPAGRRELREETGYISDNWKPLGKIASNPVFMDSYVYHYLAEGARARYDLALDEGEDVEIVEIPVPEVRNMLYAGKFQQPHTVNALVRYFAGRS